MSEKGCAMKNKSKNKYSLDNRIDYGVLLPVFVLSLIGLAALYVALNFDSSVQDVMGTMSKQVLWILMGALAVIILMQFTSEVLWKLTPFFYLLGLGLNLSLVWFHDERTAALTGARNWLKVGSFSFQPSELMKIAFILMLAYIVTRHNLKHSHTMKADFQLIGKLILATIPIVISLKYQNDLGTMLVYVAILGGVFLMSGISWKIVAPTIILFIAVAGGVLYMITQEAGREFLAKNLKIEAYQFARIDSWLDPFHDTSAASMQQSNALIAIGSGGIAGKGFNVSEVWVPVRESDMIFTIIGENFGFIGGCLVILMYFILIYRMIRVCFDTNNEFYTYIATGIIMMILFHVFENIGSNIGLLPLTGIPLPFISQGGSAILSNFIGVGLILSMRFQSDTAG